MRPAFGLRLVLVLLLLRGRYMPPVVIMVVMLQVLGLPPNTAVFVPHISVFVPHISVFVPHIYIYELTFLSVIVNNSLLY